MAMNVFLQAFILGCVSEIVYGEMSGAMCRLLERTENECESYHVVLSYESRAGKAKNEKVSYRKHRIYIGNHVT